MRDAEPRLAPASRGAMLIIDEATLRDDEELPDDDALPDGYVVRGVRYPRPVARPASATKAAAGGGASRQERDIEDVRAVEFELTVPPLRCVLCWLFRPSLPTALSA